MRHIKHIDYTNGLSNATTTKSNFTAENRPTCEKCKTSDINKEC